MMTLKINREGREHHLFLLFWPVFGLRYVLIERFVVQPQYHEVYCFLDDIIPFREEFLIPYVLWYVFFIGMHIYTCFYDREAFMRYTKYLLVAFSISTLTFLVFPTCQNLRPEQLPRDNFLSDLVGFLYLVDTNTNVCPSEHVIGSVGAFLAVCHTKRLRKPGLTALFAVLAFLTSIATVFLKQHSVIDVLAAIPVCLIAWWFSFRKK